MPPLTLTQIHAPRARFRAEHSVSREHPPAVAYMEELWRAARKSMTYPSRWHQTYPKTKVSYCVCPLCKQYRKLLAARSTSVRDLV